MTAARNRLRHRGIALMIVMTTLAVVTVLATAMLASSVLHAQMSDSLPRIAQAEYLAESGIHWGIAKLRADANSAEFVADTPGTYASRTYGPLALGTSGECTIKITRERDWHHFRIESTAIFRNDMGDILAQHKVEALVKAEATMAYKQAAIIHTNDVIIDLATVGGSLVFDSVAARGRLRFGNSSSLRPTGLAFADMFMPPLSLLATQRKTPYSLAGVPETAQGDLRPRLSDMRRFERYVWHDGVTYSAQTLPVSSNLLQGRTLRRTAINPAGIYRHVGNLTIGANVNLEGTLIVENGDVTVNGPGGLLFFNSTIDATQSHSRGFPALVIRDGGLIYPSSSVSGKLLAVRGVTWVAAQLGGTGGSGSTIEFDGAVICAGGVPRTAGRIDFNYSNINNDVPTLDETLPSQVSIRSWKTVVQ